MGLLSKNTQEEAGPAAPQNSGEPPRYSEEAMEKAFQNMAGSHPWLSRQQDKYRDSKHGYMEIYAQMTMNVAQWRVMAFACFAVLIVSVLGNVYLSSSVRVQPFVVQVDEHGYAIPIAPADEANIDYRIITSQIAQFIFNTRVRVMDREAQVYFSRTSYKSVGDASNALRELNAYYRKFVPTQAKEPTHVNIQAIIPISEQTYQADWSERTGNTEKFYSGTFKIVVSPPSDVANLINNPLGVYITDFTVREKLN